ncbi:MAG: tyrosine-type recombinase/integrase [Nitrospirae bacterium]|nr:tyrosine-type recombinase/integrase [Nitrospirota bacterium]
MRVYQRGRTYWVTVKHQGKRIRRSLEVTDQRLAERIAGKIQTEIAEGKWLERKPDQDRTCRQMIERYLEEHSKRNKAHTSYIRDKSLSDHLLAFFGDRPLAEIRPKLIAEYKSTRRADAAAPKTINHELGLLSHAFKLAVAEWEWTDRNPVLGVSRETVNNLIERWLTSEEETALLDASPGWLKEILVFAVNTGLRQSEILNLEWPQVDLFRRTITLLKQKNKQVDTLPVNARVLEILKTRTQVRHLASAHVFTNREGKRLDARNLLRAFYAARKDAKIEHLRFHDLRHTFATRLVQAGVDLYTVQKLGRWRTVQMVVRYAHHFSESLRPGVEALDRVGSADQDTNRAQSQKKGLAPQSQPVDFKSCGGEI